MECIVRGVPVFYEIYGAGTPIIFLHGFSCDHRVMKSCMETIFTWQQGWLRIYPDLPGMGRTPGGHVQSTDDVLDIVIDFIDAVLPGQQFLIAGESYGGYLSRAVLHRKFEQVAGMALICPGIVMERSKRDLPPRTVMVENSTLLTGVDPVDAAEFASIAVVQDQYNWERFRDEVLSGAMLADGASLRRIEQQYSCSFDVDKLPQPFSQPVLFLMGRQDHVAGYRDAWRILENYPHATFAILDRAGHNLQIEQTQIFNTLVDEWLNRVRDLKAFVQ